MGQRTQIGVNVEFVGKDGVKYVEREVYHFQWGGYSTCMFENLVGFFINVRNYIYKVKEYTFFSSEIEQNLIKFGSNNCLKEDLINQIKSDKCFKTSNEILDYKVFGGKTINELTEKEYYNFLLNYQDCDDGLIMIDVLLDGKNSYCKWNFNKNYNNDISIFENATKGITKDTNAIKRYWKFNKDYCKEFKKIIDFIEYMTILSISSNEVLKTVEYDGEHFKNKFENFLNDVEKVS